MDGRDSFALPAVSRVFKKLSDGADPPGAGGRGSGLFGRHVAVKPDRPDCERRRAVKLREPDTTGGPFRIRLWLRHESSGNDIPISQRSTDREDQEGEEEAVGVSNSE